MNLYNYNKEKKRKERKEKGDSLSKPFCPFKISTKPSLREMENYKEVMHALIKLLKISETFITTIMNLQLIESNPFCEIKQLIPGIFFFELQLNKHFFRISNLYF